MSGSRGPAIIFSVFLLTILAVLVVYNYVQKQEMLQRLYLCDRETTKIRNDHRIEIARLNDNIKNIKEEAQKDRATLTEEIKQISSSLHESKNSEIDKDQKLEQCGHQLNDKIMELENSQKDLRSTKEEEERVKHENDKLKNQMAKMKPDVDRPKDVFYDPFKVDHFVYQNFFKDFEKGKGLFVEIDVG